MHLHEPKKGPKTMVKALTWSVGTWQKRPNFSTTFGESSQLQRQKRISACKPRVRSSLILTYETTEIGEKTSKIPENEQKIMFPHYFMNKPLKKNWNITGNQRDIYEQRRTTASWSRSSKNRYYAKFSIAAEKNRIR